MIALGDSFPGEAASDLVSLRFEHPVGHLPFALYQRNPIGLVLREFSGERAEVLGWIPFRVHYIPPLRRNWTPSSPYRSKHYLNWGMTCSAKSLMEFMTLSWGMSLTCIIPRRRSIPVS